MEAPCHQMNDCSSSQTCGFNEVDTGIGTKKENITQTDGSSIKASVQGQSNSEHSIDTSEVRKDSWVFKVSSDFLGVNC
jgi:hypothetical protein